MTLELVDVLCLDCKTAVVVLRQDSTLPRYMNVECSRCGRPACPWWRVEDWRERRPVQPELSVMIDVFDYESIRGAV